jgi:membrane protein YqaA with SNARE-associated domain
MEVAAYGGMFLAAFLAATILPAQSEIVLVGLLASGRLNTGILIAVATFGNTLGAVANWFLGRCLERFGSRFRLLIPSGALERARRVFLRYGVWSLLFSWLPIGGDALTVVAGVMRVNLYLFVVLVGIGKGARYLAIAGALPMIGL